MKLLIVDDSRPMRDMIKRFLAGIALDTRECEDGDEALAVYSAFQPDWVLMDYQMTRMDGLAATRAILSADPGARVLILTHFDDLSLRAAAHEAGASGYVLKEDLRELRGLLSPGRRTDR